MTNSTPIAFVDTETFGLNPDKHAMWEVALIIRDAAGCDTEFLWQIKPGGWEIEEADPKALEINGFHDRFVLPNDYQAGDMTHLCGMPHPVTRDKLRSILKSLLTDAVLVGSNPSFDAGFLQVFLDDQPWHYRVVDIATLAAGYVHGLAASSQFPGTGEAVASMPFSSRGLSKQVGVEPPGSGVAHTALGDCKWARDVYDAITGGNAVSA